MTAPTPGLSLVAVVVFYGTMAGISLAIAHAVYGDPGLVHGDGVVRGLPLKAALGLSFGLAVVGATGVLTRRTRWGRELDARFERVLGTPTMHQAAVMSMTSGVAEEILFRGLLFRSLGPIVSTILFAVMHIDLQHRSIAWTVFALIVGAGLAAMTVATGDVLAAVLAHTTINYFNLQSIGQSARP